jgi:hypothetical protein
MSGHPNVMGAETSIAGLLGELSEESGELIRRELRLIAADLVAQGRRVGGSAALLGGAGLLGLGSFGALTAGLVALLSRRPARGALIVATLYAAGAGALAEAAMSRLGSVAPEAAKTLRRDLKAATLGTQDDGPAKQADSSPATSKRKRSTKSSTRFARA